MSFPFTVERYLGRVVDSGGSVVGRPAVAQTPQLLRLITLMPPSLQQRLFRLQATPAPSSRLHSAQPRDSRERDSAIAASLPRVSCARPPGPPCHGIDVALANPERYRLEPSPSLGRHPAQEQIDQVAPSCRRRRSRLGWRAVDTVCSCCTFGSSHHRR